ncbi:hypothetical protein [Streptomyces bambusae]|uniref:Uncharacterized protein n=1 Tax=Streptomyces bambusae TaxID=1550616 RepID=A0ABS6Z8F4_9ACTN|nr:hypothetical protein [Streptomyces bambusae]MBW5484049.1 hypothetical protein [Streptomyces bambusae]
MNAVRRTLVRAAAVTACAGSLLALPAAAALAEGVPAAASAQAAAAKRTLVRSLALADGVSTANVYRVAHGAYEADIVTGGTRVSTVAGRAGAAAYGGTGSLHVALQPDGRVSSWTAVPADGTRPGADAGPASDTAPGTGTGMGGEHRKTADRTGRLAPAAEPGTGKATGTGASGADSGAGSGADSGRTVRAADTGTVGTLRLTNLADGPGDGVLLLAAGGGMAAVGAAGLGFAMLRRGRTES